MQWASSEKLGNREDYNFCYYLIDSPVVKSYAIRMNKIQKFESWLKAKGYSQATVVSYIASVRQYLAQGYKMTIPDLCSWKEAETGRVSAGTVSLRIHALNKYAECLGLDVRLKPLKVDVPDYVDDELTPAMYKRLMEGLLEDKNYEWYCIIKVLACTGVRISEAIQIEAWHIRQGYIDIIGKGDKVRRVWFSASLRKDIEHFLKDGRIIKHDQRYIRSYLHRLAVRYRLPKEPMHPHAFRAFFARRVYEKCKDLQFLQKLLGHASIKTTMRYLRKSSKGMRRRISQIVDW